MLITIFTYDSLIKKSPHSWVGWFKIGKNYKVKKFHNFWPDSEDIELVFLLFDSESVDGDSGIWILSELVWVIERFLPVTNWPLVWVPALSDDIPKT